MTVPHVERHGHRLLVHPSGGHQSREAALPWTDQILFQGPRAEARVERLGATAPEMARSRDEGPKPTEGTLR
jgi:hypothetical protein